MEKSKLQAVASELNALLGLDPVINIEASEEEITNKIKEAAFLIEKGDKVTSNSVTALVELGFTEHITACGLIKSPKEKKPKVGKSPKEVRRTFTVNMVASFLAQATIAQAVQNLIAEFPMPETEAKRRIQSHAKWCRERQTANVSFNKEKKELVYA